MTFLRKLWCRIAHRGRDSKGISVFQRWRLEGGVFVRHCARCEYGWNWPGRKKGYSGPVEVTYGRNGRERVVQLRTGTR